VKKSITPIDFLVRSDGLEIMDDLDCKGKVVDQTLRELDFINHWLGGNDVTINAVKFVWNSIPKDQTITIADLGCGSGEMLRILEVLAKKENRKVELKGFDANPNITSFAKKHPKNSNNISYHAVNVFSQEFQNQKFDIILATLFMHHFTEAELVSLFSSLKKQTSAAIIINDIHRHPLAYHSIKLLTKAFSRSSMVKFDAPLSVLRAFTKPELQTILRKAKISTYELTWKWAFRWQLIIRI
jgi:2-polyprenyl-3-methyl-5-hydroxy-6-metoxy-1,4-benzoquinol methylase